MVGGGEEGGWWVGEEGGKGGGGGKSGVGEGPAGGVGRKPVRTHDEDTTWVFFRGPRRLVRQKWV